jgi:S1-C subfamily serine protease
MTALDWGIVAFTLALALWGFREGPIVGVLITTIALAFVWAFGVAALHTPGAGQLRTDVRRSTILRGLNELLPPSQTVIGALRRIDPAPSISAAPALVGPPDAAVATDPDVRRAGRSVVRVLGTACGLGVEGSGWVAAPGLVVTNAHVVAGESETTVTTGDGASLPATPVHYDPHDDLALLRVETSVPPLPLAPDPRRGDAGAVLGYPENGPFAIAPARLGDTRETITEDAYGEGPVHRSIASLRGSVRSGNSGGPLVDTRGRVLGTVFAATTAGAPGGFAIPDDVVEAALSETAPSVDTGPCIG